MLLGGGFGGYTKNQFQTQTQGGPFSGSLKTVDGGSRSGVKIGLGRISEPEPLKLCPLCNFQ